MFHRRAFVRWGGTMLALLLCFSAFMIVAVSSSKSEVVDPKTAPDVLIKGVTEEVMAIIKEDGKVKSSEAEHKKTVELVKSKIEPHFDFVAMTRLAIGVHWRKATPEQQHLLVDEFHSLLLHTYTQVLFLYRDNSIVFMPLRSAKGATEITVRLKFRQKGRAEIHVDFLMEKMPKGWMVYEVIVDGVSLIATYRDSFRDEIKESGIDGLIKTLREKNTKREK